MMRTCNWVMVVDVDRKMLDDDKIDSDRRVE